VKLTDIVQPNVALKTNQLTLDLTCVADPANVLNDKGMELWNYATGTKHVAGGLYQGYVNSATFCLSICETAAENAD